MCLILSDKSVLSEIIANANTLLTSFGLRADGGGVVMAGSGGGGS